MPGERAAAGGEAGGASVGTLAAGGGSLFLKVGAAAGTPAGAAAPAAVGGVDPGVGLDCHLQLVVS